MENLEISGSSTEPLPPLASVEGEGFNREQLLVNSLQILKKMEERLMAQRFKVREGDKEYLAYARAYSSLLMTVNTVARDIEIEELQREVEELKEANG